MPSLKKWSKQCDTKELHTHTHTQAFAITLADQTHLFTPRINKKQQKLKMMGSKSSALHSKRWALAQKSAPPPFLRLLFCFWRKKQTSVEHQTYFNW